MIEPKINITILIIVKLYCYITMIYSYLSLSILATFPVFGTSIILTLSKIFISTEDIHKNEVLTWANLVTVLRTLLSGFILIYSLFISNYSLSLLGLFIYWSLDIADGYLARVLKQETILGAKLDIVSDRILITLFAINLLHKSISLLPVIILYLIEFAGLDYYLSSQFIKWKLLSPNYFYKIDFLIWVLNWSPIAKVLNSGLTIILLIFSRSFFLSLFIISIIIIIKTFSFFRLSRLTKESKGLFLYQKE